MLPTSSPRVGWSRMSSFSAPVDFARDDQLLLVPSGQGAGGHIGRRGADVVLRDPLTGRLLDGAEVAEDARANGDR